jgi:ribonuclease HI
VEEIIKVQQMKMSLSAITCGGLPGHAGVRGNERADRLAGTAVISDGCAMDRADVLHALREAGSVEDSLGDKESSTM